MLFYIGRGQRTAVKAIGSLDLTYLCAEKRGVIGMIENHTILNLTWSTLTIVPCCKPTYANAIKLDQVGSLG